jgi:hypothetical protein
MAFRFWAGCLNLGWTSIPADQISRVLRDLLCDLLGQIIHGLIALDAMYDEARSRVGPSRRVLIG